MTSDIQVMTRQLSLSLINGVFDDNNVRIWMPHSSELHGWLLNGQQVESLLALHSLLLIGVVGGEASWMCAHRWIVVLIMELIEQQ